MLTFSDIHLQQFTGIIPEGDHGIEMMAGKNHSIVITCDYISRKTYNTEHRIPKLDTESDAQIMLEYVYKTRLHFTPLFILLHLRDSNSVKGHSSFTTNQTPTQNT